MFKKYKEQIAALEAEVEKLKKELQDEKSFWECEKNSKEEDVLSKYKYAILVGDFYYPPILWNDGRFEQGVREIDFHSEHGWIPELHTKK